MILKAYLVTAILSLSCIFQKNNIMVTGVASNSKGGAVVLADDKKVYFIDGLESWDKKVYGKKVKVTGELVVENTAADAKKVVVQEVPGIKRIIKKPKWVLLE